MRETCGATIYSINVVCPDIIKRHSSSILPFVFFGMHESISPGGKSYLFKGMSLLSDAFIKNYCYPLIILTIYFKETSGTTSANSNWEEVWQEGTPCK